MNEYFSHQIEILREPEGIPGSSLCPGPFLAVAGILKVNQWVGALSLFSLFCLQIPLLASFLLSLSCSNKLIKIFLKINKGKPC